jgi:3-methyladenine DNA glycosylase AlkD
MIAAQVLRRLQRLARPDALAGMARYGIDTANAYGVSVSALRTLARELGRDQALARALWASGVHDARLLATMVAEPGAVSAKQAAAWARDFRSWDLCDQCCLNLLRHVAFAHELARDWATRKEEFVRRAAFSLIAVLAVHDKAAPDARFERHLPLIEAAADDPRPMVRKSVNWALRQIGKRNRALNGAAIAAAERIALRGGAARWVASDALRELKAQPVQARLQTRAVPRATAPSRSGRTRTPPGSARRPARTRRPPRRA